MADLRPEVGGAFKWPVGFVAAGASCAALAGTLLWKPAPVLLWNASPSSPVGLYLVSASRRPDLGEIAIAWPPPSARGLAARRHYLPAGVPLVKNVAAASGARVCAKGRTVFVNGRPVAVRRFRDRAGRRLPWWSGCHNLGDRRAVPTRAARARGIRRPLFRHHSSERNHRQGQPAMAALRSLVIAAALACSAPGKAGPVDRWSGQIAEASERFGVPAAWIRRVMLAESGGEVMQGGRPIVSSAGAMGLMQLMPGTWRDMRLALGLGADPHDPHDNILAGTAYLRLMYDRFGYPGLFAAYNAGPARYAAHLMRADPLPAETRAYLAAVAPARTRRPTIESGSFAGLFALRAVAAPVIQTQSPDSSPDGLFVALTGPAPR